MSPDAPVGDRASRPQTLHRANLADQHVVDGNTAGEALPLESQVNDVSNIGHLPTPSTPTDDWVRDHYGQIHRAAWMMTGDAWAAEDLAQETFVVAIDKWNSFDGRSTRATWLYGILIRRHQRHKRTLSRLARRLKTYAFQNESLRNDKTNHADPAVKLATESWRQSVWADVACLPPAQCQAITLRYAQNLSYEEIATATGCPIGTIKTRVHHGLKRLKQTPPQSDLPEALDHLAPNASHPS